MKKTLLSLLAASLLCFSGLSIADNEVCHHKEDCLKMGFLVGKVYGEERTIPYYEKSCYLGEAQGCVFSGFSLLKLLKLERSQEVLKYGCEDLRDGESCETLALALTFVDPKDKDKVEYYQKKACSLGRESACK